MHFDGSAIDGPFQLYNGLRRIAAGFTPGVDFQYFHGLGIPYLHYWIFPRSSGLGCAASQLAREMLTAVAYPIVLVVFFRAFAGDTRRALCLAAAAFAAHVCAQVVGDSVRGERHARTPRRAPDADSRRRCS